MHINEALDNQCTKYVPSTTKHIRDIALQSVQPAQIILNVILAIILQNMKHLCQKLYHCKTDSN